MAKSAQVQTGMACIVEFQFARSLDGRALFFAELCESFILRCEAR
jgi:hypothetical protein